MSLDYYVLDDDETIRGPVSMEEWIKTAPDRPKHIGREEVLSPSGETFTVSTVFLAMDHNWGGGAPILFETMIFGPGDDEYQERYCTIEQAREGHRVACDLVRSGGYPS